MLRQTRLAVVIALAWLAVGCGGTRAASSRPISAMNVAAAEQLPERQFNHALAGLAANGVRVVRSDAPWAVIQPHPPKANDPGWRWGQTDAWVSAFARHGVTWEPILDYSVWWAKVCVGFCAPITNSTYAAFAQAVAQRYGVHGSYWAEHPGIQSHPVRIFEIWNEENIPTFWIAPERYASLYSAASQAIHGVDPTAAVIVGGLAEDSGPFNPRRDGPSNYLRLVLDAEPGLAGHIDGFGLHPYGAAATDVVDWVAHFRETLDTLGETRAPLYLTEFGWPTGTARGESWRAQQMSSLGAALTRSNCGIRLVAPYDWTNPGAVPLNDFGLAQPSVHAASAGHGVTLRPAGLAWFRSFRRSRPELRLCPQAGAVHMPR